MLSSNEQSEGLQDVPLSTPASPEATALAASLLRGTTSTIRAIEDVGRFLSALPRVDVVVASLISLEPERGTGWIQLGQRAFLRQWARPGSPCTVIPADDAGAELALSLPWMSARARHDVLAVTDVELLPAEADQDRRELEACNVRSILGSSQIFSGVMFGSVSIASAEVGPWPPSYVADLRLLGATLGCRMATARAELSLADAIARGDQASSAQQSFFAAIGHELRTPVSAILGFAEVLAEEAGELETAPVPAGSPESIVSPRLARFPGSVARDAHIIVRAGEQLLAIVEDLLSTGRLLGDEQPRETVVLSEAVQDVMHWLSTTARNAQVTLRSDVAPDLEVLATPASVRQILTNLVANGIDHNELGGTVEVTATRSVGEAGEPRVRIVVRDSGPGLSHEELVHVFEPFVRLTDSTRQGAGLGLPLSRTLVERHGGMLGVESTPGQGSAFWVDLPVGPETVEN